MENLFGLKIPSQQKCRGNISGIVIFNHQQNWKEKWKNRKSQITDCNPLIDSCVFALFTVLQSPANKQRRIFDGIFCTFFFSLNIYCFSCDFWDSFILRWKRLPLPKYTLILTFRDSSHLQTMSEENELKRVNVSEQRIALAVFPQTPNIENIFYLRCRLSIWS